MKFGGGLQAGERGLKEFSHTDEKGRVRMVDVSGKDATRREAVAAAELQMQPSTLERILADDLPKGDVLAVARTAGILAAKQTHTLIPMCHQLGLDSVSVDFETDPERPGVLCLQATAVVNGRTGVEMEALLAATLAGLTVYDMCKAVDRGMVLGEVRLLEKSGGRSGHYQRS